jgi:hypothetical protein
MINVLNQIKISLFVLSIIFSLSLLIKNNIKSSDFLNANNQIKKNVLKNSQKFNFANFQS